MSGACTLSGMRTRKHRKLNKPQYFVPQVRPRRWEMTVLWRRCIRQDDEQTAGMNLIVSRLLSRACRRSTATRRKRREAHEQASRRIKTTLTRAVPSAQSVRLTTTCSRWLTNTVSSRVVRLRMQTPLFPLRRVDPRPISGWSAPYLVQGGGVSTCSAARWKPLELMGPGSR